MYGSTFAKAPLGLKGETSKVTQIAAYIDNIDTPETIPGVLIDKKSGRPAKGKADKDLSPPYLMGWHPFASFPDLYGDIAPAPVCIDDWVLSLDPVMRDVFQWVAARDYWSIFIGPEGSLSELHQDYWDTHAYLAQIQGRKRCTLFSPSDSPLLYDGKVDPEHPDPLKYPLFEEATAYECIIGPGDLLFMPSNWWHHVRGLEKSITVSHNFFNEVNFSPHLIRLMRRMPQLISALDEFPQWKDELCPPWRSNGFSELTSNG
jgi:hypothetical protein